MSQEVKHYYEVAVGAPLTKTFTYSSVEKTLKSGARVLVPFGGRKLTAVILRDITKNQTNQAYKVKPIIKKLEEKALFTQELLELAQWLSAYYHHPLGEVLKVMIPHTTQQSLVKVWTLHKDKLPNILEEQEKHLIQKIFSTKTQLNLQTVQKKYKDLKKSYPDLPPLEQLKKKKWVHESLEEKRRINLDKDKRRLQNQKNQADKNPRARIKLTYEQETACHGIFELIKTEPKPKPFLLQGVTGSGKTEVYLNLIDRIINQENLSSTKPQALVLVPEISLTPQMTLVFKRKFPEQVAVVHSAMPENHRYTEIIKIFNNEKQILIGPRSSVFVPFQNLKLIVVDEEHDTSYKQNTQFSYHAKDTAIVRAHKLKIPVILGSATPSTESFWNAKIKKYHHFKLTKRVHNQDLPQIKLKEIPAKLKGEKLLLDSLASREKAKDKNTKLVSDEILSALQNNFRSGKQSIVIVNRRGYAYYLLDLNTKKAYTCPECSVSMTLHNHMKTLSCHYCERTLSTKTLLEKTDTTYIAIGYGSQKAEIYLQEQIPEAKIVRLDSDIAKKREELTKILGDFRQEKIDILVGTQILAKGHDFPKVTLVALLEIDEHLNLPDFRSGERTFQLLVQAAGRAGRSKDKGEVLIQTTRKEHKLIHNATQHNYDAFIEDEIKFREKYSYPPFCKMILLEFSSLNNNQLENYTTQLQTWLEKYLTENQENFLDLRIQGPYKPGIEKINKRWRKHLLFRSKNMKSLHQLITLFLSSDKKRPPSIRLKIDVDPQSML